MGSRYESGWRTPRIRSREPFTAGVGLEWLQLYDEAGSTTGGFDIE
jgi:hypothetical protein